MPKHDNAQEREEEHDYMSKTREKQGLTDAELQNAWFGFIDRSPRTTKSIHTSLMSVLWHIYGRCGRPTEFQVGRDEVMRLSGISSRTTYYEKFDEVEEFGAVKVVAQSANVYTAKWLTFEGLPFYLSKECTPTRSATSTPTRSATSTPTRSASGTNNKGIKKQGNKALNNKGNISDAVTVVPEESNSQETLFELTPVEEKKAVAKPKEYTLTHRLRLEVEKRRPAYRWSAKDGKAAKTLVDQIKFRVSKESGKEPTDEEILYNFNWLVDHLPPFYANKWDTVTLSSKFESIMLELEKGPVGGSGKKPTLADSMAIIERAGERLRQQSYSDDLFESFGNF